MGNGCARWAAVLAMFCAATARTQDVEPEELLDELSFWEQFFTLRAGLGYSDNILYSEVNQKSSGMLVSGFDATLYRLPLDGTEVTVFASIDDRRYFDGGTITNLVSGPVATNRVDDVRGERTIIGLAQVKRDFSGNWQTGLTGQYFYQDQVVDLSLTEVDLSTLPVEGHQLVMDGEITRRLGGNRRLRLELIGERQIFDGDEVDDYFEYGPRLGFGLELPRGSTLEIVYELELRDYDTREEYTSDGIPLTGTSLSYQSHEVELDWSHHFDEAKRWRLRTRGGYGRNDDSGSGYFNYNQAYAGLQLRYRDEQWEVEGQSRWSWYRYDEQLSDEDPDERRHRETIRAGLRASRRLGESWRVFAEYEFERALSNVSYDRYTVNVVSGGLAWEF